MSGSNNPKIKPKRVTNLDTQTVVLYAFFHLTHGAGRKYLLVKMDLSREDHANPYAGFVFQQFHHISNI